jgi:hypothetical protein
VHVEDPEMTAKEALELPDRQSKDLPPMSGSS